MFWDEKEDSEETQRFKNLIILKFWGTNKERDEFFDSPVFWIFFAVIVLIFVLLVC